MKTPRARFGIAFTFAILTMVSGFASDSEVFGPLASFETLVGAWKGTARPATNRIRGWNEKHTWGWRFEKGVPSALGFRAEQSKILTEGRLTYEAAKKSYRLRGIDATGKSVAYSGAPGGDGKSLILEREGASTLGRERLTIRPAAGGIRYVMLLDRKEPGAPQYKNFIEVGLTKEGESIAAGSSSSEPPKCIVTGGAAGLSVTYLGVAYPLCCTGCRDEFNDNPAKYVDKAKRRATVGASAAKSSPVKTSPGRADDSEFDGLVEPAKPLPKKSASPPAPSKSKTRPAGGA